MGRKKQTYADRQPGTKMTRGRAAGDGQPATGFAEDPKPIKCSSCGTRLTESELRAADGLAGLECDQCRSTQAHADPPESGAGGRGPGVGGRKPFNEAHSGTCRYCHCTGDHACTGQDGQPCHWADDDQTICSSCMDVTQAENVKALNKALKFFESCEALEIMLAEFPGTGDWWTRAVKKFAKTLMPDESRKDLTAENAKSAKTNRKEKTEPASALSANSAVQAVSPKAPPKADLILVKVADIVADQPVRQNVTEEKLFALGESIHHDGALAPIGVRKLGDGTLRLVFGRTRLEAAIRAKDPFIEAKVFSGTGADDAWEARARLAENVQRTDLTHIELARVYGAAAKAGLSVAQIAAESHVSDDQVRRHLALLRLTPPVAELVSSGRLPVHQAELIARVGDAANQIELAESATRLSWDNKRAKWEPRDASYFGHKKDVPAEQDVDDRDYVEPMESLRREVAQAMQGLAAVGWPREAEYAGKRACAGCPDNTLSYADQPTLFAGIKPQGSDKKGHCTNEACYKAKLAVREKEREAERREREKQQKAAIVKAKRAGLDVCEGCGRVANMTTRNSGIRGAEVVKEKFTTAKGSGQKLCAACHEKDAKRLARGGDGGTYQARETARAEAAKRFPWNDEQRLAIAQWKRGEAIYKALGSALENLRPDGAEAVILAIIATWDDLNWYFDTRLAKVIGPVGVVAVGKRWTGKALRAIWEKLDLLPDHLSPKIDHAGSPRNVPLDDTAAQAIKLMEDVAKAWHVNVPPPVALPEPTKPSADSADDADSGKTKDKNKSVKSAKSADSPESLKRIETIATGNKDAALAAVAEASRAELVSASQRELKGDWRRAAVSKRISELDDAACVEADREALSDDAAEDGEE